MEPEDGKTQASVRVYIQSVDGNRLLFFKSHLIGGFYRGMRPQSQSYAQPLRSETEPAPVFPANCAVYCE